MKINSHGPNNDGCNPESCTDVLIKNCYFDTGDDCIAIKSGRNADGRRLNAPTENIIVQGCQHERWSWRNHCRQRDLGRRAKSFCRKLPAGQSEPGPRFAREEQRDARWATRGSHFRNIEVGQVAHAVITIDFNYEEGSERIVYSGRS